MQAITSIDYTDLHQVTSQDGVTIGGSVSFNNMAIKGMFVQTSSTLARAYANAARDLQRALLDPAPLAAYQAAGAGLAASQRGKILTNTYYVFCAQTGDSAKSYGSLEIKNLDMQGTKIWLFAYVIHVFSAAFLISPP